MADMLVISGTAVQILEDTFFRDDDETQGETTRAFAGNLISTERTAKRAYRCQALFLTTAAETTLRGLCPLGNSVTVGGEGIIGGPITANVRVSQSQPFEQVLSGVPTLYAVADLVIRET